MNKKTHEILNLLEQQFATPKCELNFDSDFQLLVAVILSAQCTDKRVNEVTKTLFAKYKTPADFAQLKNEELEKEIYSCGFYKNKAKNIIASSKSIVEKYNGQIPNSLEELIRLNGVGRKTANVVISTAFKQDAIAVDTHVFRLSHRLGLSNGKTPFEVEKDLMKEFDKQYWSKLHYLLVLYGRYICKSKKPNCENCKLNHLCTFFRK